MRGARTLAWMLTATLAGAAITALPAHAADELPAAAGPAGAASDPQAGAWTPWVRTLEKSREQIREERRKVEALQQALEQAVYRRYPRGEEKARIENDLAAAKKSLAEDEAQYPDLVEQARQAGVPARILLDYEDLPAS